MRHRLITLLSLFLFLLLACQFFTQMTMQVPPVVSTGVAGTLTALAPVIPSETASATPTVPALTSTPPGNTLTPVHAIGTPTPAGSISQPPGQVTLILLGSDQRPNAPDFRTDVLLVVVLRPDGSLNLISFPRDLWVYLPGRFMQRINTAQEFGGFNLLQATFQYNFGFSPQSYILTNFNGFRSIINGLGGITVSVAQDFHDERSGYPDGFTVKAGQVHMDGDTALWYVRARASSSDLDRLRRAQDVAIAIGRKFLNLNGLTRIPQLYAAFRGLVVSDLTLKDATDLLPAIQKIDPNKVHRYIIGESLVTATITSTGADVLLPNYGAIHQLLEQALGSP
jgi:LCP family protein required for cell wall assembly